MAAVPASGAFRADGGDWPHTRRVLPWGVALFLVLLYLTPINAIGLPIDLPFDSQPDRIYLVVLAVFWIAALAVGGPLAPRLRSSPIHVAGLFFLIAVLVSTFVNFESVTLSGDAELAVKRIVLLISYVVFFLIVASTLRPAEVPRLLKLLVVLAAVAGAGTVIEYATSTNVFYRLADLALPDSFDVRFAPSGVITGRRIVVGPAQHGLAITTALAMALPFAVQFLLEANDTRRRLLWLVAVGLIIGGCVSTLRKTGLLAPAAALLVLLAYRPGQAPRVVFLLAIAAGAIATVVPSAVTSVYNQLFVSDVGGSLSTQARLADYDGVRPDVLSSPLFGRGYGTYDPLRYRILDNQVLNDLITVGFIGVATFVGVILVAALMAHGAATATSATTRFVGIGTVSAVAVFALTALSFDALGFVQVPYVLLFILGTLVALSPPRPGRRSSPA